MANDRIRVDSAALQQCANEYRGALQMVLDAVQLYAGALQALAQDYTGVAAAAMAAKVAQLTKDITTAADRCTDALSELQYTETAFSGNEGDLSALVDKVDPGVKSPFGA